MSQFREQLVDDMKPLVDEFLATKALSWDEWFAPERENYERALIEFMDWVLGVKE